MRMSKRALDGWTRARVGAALAALAAFGAIVTPSAVAAPPDGRAYELVTPVDKNGSVPQFPTGGLSPFGFIGFGAITDASDDGEGLLWYGLLPLPMTTNGLPMSYESRRTPGGWVTQAASPDPTDEVPSIASLSLVGDATADHRTRIIPSTQRYDAANQAPWGRRDVYRQDAGGLLTWLTRPAGGGSPTTTEIVPYVGRDATANHALFLSFEPLVPAAAASLAGHSLYDYTGDQPVLVNVRDDGVTPVTACGATLGGGSPSSSTGGSISRGVSADGSRIYFTSPEPGASGDASCSARKALYLRTGGTTVHVSLSQRAVPDSLALRDAFFQGASSAGDIVYFSSANALTDDAANGTVNTNLKIYRYDVATRVLRLVTPNTVVQPVVRGIIHVSDDGERIYFIATAMLVPGEGITGQPNLYTWKDGQIDFIATLTGSTDQASLLGFDTARPIDATPDGERIAFVSRSDIGGYTVADRRQVFVYDAGTRALTCVSCPRTGVPSGNAALQRDAEGRIIPTSTEPRNLLDGGQTVLFDTNTSLVPEDDNGTFDVYQWRDGEVQLVSDGHGSEPSFYVDASADGRSLFFSSGNRLVPQDTNVDSDMYVARIGGGFPAPPSPPGPCTDDACQGEPTPVPNLPSVASDLDFGVGNVVPADASAAFTVRAISQRARRGLARTGRLTLVVRTREAGMARGVISARYRGKFRRAARASQRAGGARTVRLRLTLSRRAQRALDDAGWLRVRVAVRFSGADESHTAAFVLTKPRGTKG
jgi:hypothetical protein